MSGLLVVLAILAGFVAFFWVFAAAMHRHDYPREQRNADAARRRRETLDLLARHGFKCSRFLNAFDTPAGACRFCGDEVRAISAPVKRIPPSGEEFLHYECAGYVCLRCSLWSNSDLDVESDWIIRAPLVERLANGIEKE